MKERRKLVTNLLNLSTSQLLLVAAVSLLLAGLVTFLFAPDAMRMIHSWWNAPSFSGLRYPGRGIDTNGELWRAGRLGMFFRCEYFGLLPFLGLIAWLAFLATIRQRPRWQIALFITATLVAVLVSVKGYYNLRYAFTLLPFIITGILFLGMTAVNRRWIRNLLFGIASATILFSFIAQAETYRAYVSNVLRKGPASDQALPMEIIGFLNALPEGSDDTVLVMNEPWVHYYTSCRALNFNHPRIFPMIKQAALVEENYIRHLSSSFRYVVSSVYTEKYLKSYSSIAPFVSLLQNLCPAIGDGPYRLREMSDNRSINEEAWSGQDWNLARNSSFSDEEPGADTPRFWRFHIGGDAEPKFLRSASSGTARQGATFSGDNFNVVQDISQWSDFPGRPVTAFVRMRTDVPDKFAIALFDGVQYAESPLHPGHGDYMTMRVSLTVSPVADRLELRAVSAGRTGSRADSVHVDKVLLLPGRHYFLNGNPTVQPDQSPHPLLRASEEGPGLTPRASPRHEIMGMRIEGVSFGVITDTVDTTTARFSLNRKEGIITVKQRLGAERPLALITLANGARGDKLSSPTLEGFDFCWRSKATGDPVVIISGDSTVRILNASHVEIQCEFEPAYTNIYSRNGGVLWLDDAGGICIAPSLQEKPWPIELKANSWRLTGDQAPPLIFVAVCPPREFDWAKSFQNVVHYSSHLQRYPSDEQIRDFARWASVLQLHSWIWKNRHDPKTPDDTGRKPPPEWWDYSWLAPDGKWIPDNAVELRRVVTTAHRYGMLVAPYVNCDSSQADDKHFTVDARLAELRRLLAEYAFDGFYLDGLYCWDPDSSYRLARELRKCAGDNAWLTLHDTYTSFPFINSYMDLIVTSEHYGFHRWDSTSYKISNASASIWPEIPIDVDDGRPFLQQMVDNSLLHNNRMIFMTGEGGQWRDWRLHYTDAEMEFMTQYYSPQIRGMKEARIQGSE